jgi:Flp pilus assembly protein CpaB
MSRFVFCRMLLYLLAGTIERNTRGEPQGVSVATLLVSTSDAEKLILTSNEGRIQLALRNPVDTRPSETDRGQT